MANLKPLHALNLDAGQQQSFVRYFNGLGSKPATTIRFFNRTDYYTLHDDDATFAAMEVFKSTANVKTMGSPPNVLQYVVLSKGNFENFVRELLLVKQYRVEVYISQGSARNSDWVLQYKGSPGNLSQFEDMLFSNSNIVETCIVMAVQIFGDSQQRSLAVACVDTDYCTFSVNEFVDNDIFTELESLVVQMSPKECLIPKGNTDELNTLKTMLERCNILVSPQKKTDFVTKDIVQDLNGLIRFEDGQHESANSLPEINKKHAMGSLSALIKYRGLTSDASFTGQFSFTNLEVNRFVHMDSAAISALNLLPKPGARPGPVSKHHSVLGLLGRCRTAQGHRLLSKWIKQPLRDINEINERHDIVECFVNDVELRQSLHNDYLKRIPDFQMLSRKLLRKKANLQDCYRIFQSIEKLPELAGALSRNENPVVKGVFVDSLMDCVKDMQKYQEMIDQNLDLDQIQHGEYFLKPSLDEEFQQLHRQMRSCEKKIESELSRAARELGLDGGKTVKLDSNAQLGYFFRVTLKEEPVLRKNSNFRTIDAIKGGVRFTNDRLTELNENYSIAKKSYEDRQKSIVSEIIDIASGYREPLTRLSLLVAQLDVLVGYAVAACEAPQAYVRPVMLAENIVPGKIDMKGIRHPCLEQQEDVSYIANDVKFEQGGTTMHIITGPNMGGKSTFIRSVAVAVHMAHIGSFVACDSAHISIVDAILGRVGADDCIMKGLSTFMTEMIETSGILRTATNKSLVIIDELGRGTSTYEGCGIAWAIAEHFAKEVNSYTLFATHFHEITRLADELPQSVSNLHVSALVDNKEDGNVFTLLYKIKPGVCNKSFGLEVAKMAGFPDEVVKFAEHKHSQLEDNTVNADFETVEHADKIIADFLTKCKAIQSSDLDDIELMESLKPVLEGVKSSKNVYLKALLNKAGM